MSTSLIRSCVILGLLLKGPVLCINQTLDSPYIIIHKGICVLSKVLCEIGYTYLKTLLSWLFARYQLFSTQTLLPYFHLQITIFVEIFSSKASKLAKKLSS